MGIMIDCTVYTANVHWEIHVHADTLCIHSYMLNNNMQQFDKHYTYMHSLLLAIYKNYQKLVLSPQPIKIEYLKPVITFNLENI